MALPRIHHATTRDGVRIAFHTVGDGPAVVMLFPYHVNHLALNWQVPLHRGAIEFFARYFTVVNLDFRGVGLSACRIDRLSLGTFANAALREGVANCLSAVSYNCSQLNLWITNQPRRKRLIVNNVTFAGSDYDFKFKESTARPSGAPSCGVYNVVGSGGFYGRDMRVSINATSRTCYNFNMTIALSH